MLSPTEHARLSAMRAKYEALIALRTAPAEEDAPRAELRALAQRFPGALRELDQRSLVELQARRSAMDAALDGAPPPDWFTPQDLYHRFLRAALRLRPALRAGRALPEAPDDELSAGALGETWLSAIDRPEGGRLNPLAYAFVAQQTGMSVPAVTLLVAPRFGADPVRE